MCAKEKFIVQGFAKQMCYLQGFIQYRMTGESTHLDVDTLNEKLQLKGAERMRTSMRPDEAFGMIFSFDGVIADMQQVNLPYLAPKNLIKALFCFYYLPGILPIVSVLFSLLFIFLLF